MEPLKDPSLGLDWNSWSLILHRQRNLSTAPLQSNPDPAAGWTVLKGIAEQVDQQAAQLRFHPPNHGIAVFDRRFQGYLPCSGSLAEAQRRRRR